MRKKTTLINKKELYRRALRDAVIKLNPRHLVRNPVMFVVEIGSLLLTALFLASLFRVDAVSGTAGADSPAFIAAIAA